MGVLSELKPAKVFQFFEEICSIPHGSQNVEQISNYLVGFAKSRGLKYRQDEKFNVIIWKDASAGYEGSAPVILQGHMDMVAVKTEDCQKDLAAEGLDLEIKGDYISAAGTSLGGDDGIAVAYSLAVLDDASLAHPPLEVIFTVDEEIGMLGADYMDVSDLKGRLFINMDSEDEGVFTVSCAGGATVICHFPYQREEIRAGVLTIDISNFSGGHSGIEIDKGRANANVEMGKILYAIKDECRLLSMDGGAKDNAIALDCKAVVAVSADKIEDIKQKILDVFAGIKEEYSSTDPDAVIQIETEKEKTVEAMTQKDTISVIRALLHMPAGIQRMNPDMKDMVQTSLNLGILKTTEDNVELSYAVRSSSDNEKEFLINKMKDLTVCLGGSTEIFGAYPGWEYRADSKLREAAITAYKSLYGKEPVVEGIHAGLECGLFASKLDDLDAISFGPQMSGVHTVNEILSISSAQRTWELLVKILSGLK